MKPEDQEDEEPADQTGTVYECKSAAVEGVEAGTVAHSCWNELLYRYAALTKQTPDDVESDPLRSIEISPDDVGALLNAWATYQLVAETRRLRWTLDKIEGCLINISNDG